eukprot:COSAG06_NODE_332_length_17366_cov_6.152024_4_plen_149_part_00
MPDDPQAPPTLGGGTGLGSMDGSVLGGVLGSTAMSGSGFERDMATNGRMSAAEETMRQEATLPTEATTYEAMLGMNPAAVTARKRYVKALSELEERLRICDPMRQWGGLRCGADRQTKAFWVLFFACLSVHRQKCCSFVKTGSVWTDT